MTSDTLWTEANRLQGIEISLIRQVMNNAPAGAINMALGELAFPLPEYLKHAAIDIISRGNARYTPNAGIPSLREQIAGYYGGECQAGQICISNGAEEAVYLSLLSLINPGDRIAIPDPDYTAYPPIAGMMGAEVLRLPLQDDLSSIDWQLWEELLEDHIKVLLLSNPSNPCGFCYTPDDLHRLSEICNKHHIIVIMDEIYRHLYIHEAQSEPENEFNYLIRINGLSKSHCMSGWRIGWINAPLAIAPAIVKAKQYVSTCAPWLSQKLAEVALSPEGWEQAELIRLRLAKNQAMAAEALKSLDVPILVPKAGPYIMIKIPGSDLDFATRAAQKGLICVPGRAFGQRAKGWIRINIAIDEADLDTGLQILERIL